MMSSAEVEQTGASSQFYDKFSACDFFLRKRGYDLKVTRCEEKYLLHSEGSLG